MVHYPSTSKKKGRPSLVRALVSIYFIFYACLTLEFTFILHYTLFYYMPQNLSVKRDYIAMGNIILAFISTNNTIQMYGSNVILIRF